MMKSERQGVMEMLAPVSKIKGTISGVMGVANFTSVSFAKNGVSWLVGVYSCIGRVGAE